MKNKIIFLIILIILLFFSCFQKKIKFVKYREKNHVDILKINSFYGDIKIIGWTKNFIEIYTQKILLTGLNSDFNDMNTSFLLKDNVFNITTKIPARVNAKINLEIYVPHTLLKTYIYSDNGDINIKNYLGDINIKNNTGTIDSDFYGNYLNISSKNTKIYLNINSKNYSDVLINNEKGNTFVNLNSTGNSSYLDFNSIDGDVDFNINKKIAHKLVLINKADKLKKNYKLNTSSYLHSDYVFFKGTTGDLTNIKKPILIYINSLNGSVIINKK